MKTYMRFLILIVVYDMLQNNYKDSERELSDRSTGPVIMRTWVKTHAGFGGRHCEHDRLTFILAPIA